MADGHQPLLEPAVLVTENCPECRGTGVVDVMGDGPSRECEPCEGSGRQVVEVPMSAAWDLMAEHHGRMVAPPPSALREREAAD